MRIAVVGAANQGKSTFVNDFLENWPMYKKGEGNYRNLIKAKKLQTNKTGNAESQALILNSIMDEAMEYEKSDFVIHDRCVLDNLVYTMWLASKETGGVDDAFVNKSLALAKQGLHFYDIILYFPILEKYKIEPEEREGRETDNVYNEEIDNFFKAIQQTYTDCDETVFEFSSPDGAPALIELFGGPRERIEMMKLYLDTDGDVFGKSASDSLLQLPDIEEQATLDKIVEQNKL
tara:strand:- start:771 stop:1472 length:702 start_codon:yes stop_codon:yes gene_type:complete